MKHALPAGMSGRRVDTHTLIVVSRDGTASMESSSCTEKQRCVPLDECAACVSFGGHGTSAWVVCTALADDGDAAAPSHTDEPSVRTILTREVVCVREQLTLTEVVGVLVEYGVNGVPVVDAHTRLIGLVTKTDIVAAVGRGVPLEHVVVGEVMVRHAITILESSSISRAAAIMAFKRVHRLPVLSDEGCVVGIVSAMDVLQEISDRKGYLMPPHSLPLRGRARQR